MGDSHRGSSVAWQDNRAARVQVPGCHQLAPVGHDEVWGLSHAGLSGGFCSSRPRLSLCLDTSFMYMIAGLCMLKLYQKRHPDINASAYSAYACLAIVIFFLRAGRGEAPGPLCSPGGQVHPCAHPPAHHPLPERSLLLP